MNIDYFHDGTEYLIHCALQLCAEEKVLLENSLITIKSENRFAGIYLWGRITGIAKDYYIAYGYTTDCINDRKYFYSIDAYLWFMLPFINDPRIFEAAILCTQPFSGDPGFKKTVQLDQCIGTEVKMDKYEKQKNEVELLEEDRLSAIVVIITTECAICPRGSMYKLADGYVVPNLMFRGLNELQCDMLSNYQIFRLPRNKIKTNIGKRSDYNYPVDFLDGIECIIPNNGEFILNMLHCEGLILIKSCAWLGMTFFHKTNSQKYGFLYFGDGRKNYDLSFMY